jgi:dienelactone hydrolase
MRNCIEGATDAGAPHLRSRRASGTLWPVPGVGMRLAVLVAVGLSLWTLGSPVPSRAQPALRRAALPAVLHLVDTSRSVRLPGGRRIARPVTTYLWYPPSADGNGPWPLVVFGHGFATTPFRYRRLLRAWAAAGYLVAAPLFPLGNAHAPGGPDENDILNQPRDMRFVITRLLAASASPESPLHGLVDATRIAVAGQSDGAETAFATAFQRPWHDRRVRAAVILSGAELGSHVSLISHGPPLLAVQGTADRINPPVYTLDLFHAAGRPKFLLLLRRAGHLRPYTVPGRPLAAVERVSIAFLDHYLRGGPTGAISRAAAAFPEDTLTAEP